MKKLVVLAVFALSLFASGAIEKPHDNPIPTCNPCDWVR